MINQLKNCLSLKTWVKLKKWIQSKIAKSLVFELPKQGYSLLN